MNSLLGNRLRHTRNSRLRQRIVDLTSITIDTTRARDVNDVPRLAILYTEIWRRSPDNLEWRSRMQIDNGVPLLVRHLVNDTVPSVSGIVDDNVDLAIAEFCCLFDESLDVRIVENVAGDGNGAAAVRFDGVDDGLRFLCERVRYVDCVNA
jgi:hypothetical protein